MANTGGEKHYESIRAATILTKTANAAKRNIQGNHDEVWEECVLSCESK